MPTDSFPWETALGPLLLAVLAVTTLVISDLRNWRPGRYLCKPLAATAFLWLALALDATGSTYGNWLLAGLLLCMLGDILLMFDAQHAFLGGLLAFLSGHLLYAIAFLHLPTSWVGLALSVLPVVLLAVLTLRWLRPHLDGPMRQAVPAYILVICGMLLCAGTTAGNAAALPLLSGAWGFAFSDLAVARRQFIRADWINGLWGTPLYFGSQLLLAATVFFV
mgnify:CR=1 FL=1